MFLWSRCPFYVVAHYKMPVSVYAFVILFVSTTAWMCVCLCRMSLSLLLSMLMVTPGAQASETSTWRIVTRARIGF